MATLLGRNIMEPLPDSGELELAALSKDVERLICLIDTLGTAMKPVKNDVSGNMAKILDSRDKLCPQVTVLRELLETEIHAEAHKKDPSACVGILWLYRGMAFFFRFLEIVHETREEAGDSLQAAVSAAYDETLKSHHNFVMRGIFNMVSRAVPRRSTLKLRLMDNDASKEEELMKEFDAIIASMRPIQAAIQQLLTRLDIK